MKEEVIQTAENRVPGPGVGLRRRDGPGASAPDSQDAGFTLVELLIVVLIISIIAAIAMPIMIRQRERAFLAAVTSDLRNAAANMEAYFADANEYPSESERDDTAVTDGRLGVVAFELSPAVTLTIVEPAVLGGSQMYCITAHHPQVDGGAPVARSYHSAGGGLIDGDAC